MVGFTSWVYRPSTSLRRLSRVW